MSKKEETIDVADINFHPVLKDIENMFWFFILSIRTLSDIDIQGILKTKNSKQEGYASFNQMLDKFNKTTNFNVEINKNTTTSKLNVLNEMIFMGKAMAILIYEFLSTSSYFIMIKKDKEFKFLKHIRNGAAHNNRFNFKYKYGKNKGAWIIGEKEIVEWNGMKISRDLQDKNVFNDFISVFGVFLLAKHFSERLVGVDGEQK